MNLLLLLLLLGDVLLLFVMEANSSSSSRTTEKKQRTPVKKKNTASLPSSPAKVIESNNSNNGSPNRTRLSVSDLQMNFGMRSTYQMELEDLQREKRDLFIQLQEEIKRRKSMEARLNGLEIKSSSDASLLYSRWKEEEDVRRVEQKNSMEVRVLNMK